MHLNNLGTQTIETERLILRRFSVEDSDHMFKNWINDKLVQSNYGEPVYESINQVQTLLEQWISSYSSNGFYRWGIVLKEKSENIGQIAFCSIELGHHYADIEYCISRFYQGKGYATEALDAVIKFSFEKIGLNRLQAFHRGENKASEKVLKKSKMKYEGTLRQAFYYQDKNEYDDKVYYGIVRADYLNLEL